MEIKKGIKFATTLFASAFVLAACGNSDEPATEQSSAASSAVTSEASSAASSEASSDQAAAGDLQDGSYKLEEKNLDENGWRVVYEMTVSDGKITESNYDYVNENGDLKSEDEDYQKAMSEKVGTGPADYIPELNAQLEETQDPSQVDVVSGATHSSESFIKYAQQLIDAAKEGKTETIEIDN